MNKNLMGGGAIIFAILIALTEFFAWATYLNYVWAGIVLAWGILSFFGN